MGIPIDSVTMEETLRAIERSIAEGGFHQIATANVDFLLKSIDDGELKEILCRCDMVLPDGMPLVWASRLMGYSLKERVSGSDLVPRVAELSARRGYKIFMLGASEAASRAAAERMVEHYPGVRIAGRYCPPYRGLDEMDHEEMLRQIERAEPDILLVAFGNPKQEKWLAMHRYRLRVPVCIGVGGSFDLVSGNLSRAPLWMRANGLEWLFRIYQEPARLAARYAHNAYFLARYLPKQLAATAAHKPRVPLGQITAEIIGSATVLRVNGSLTEDQLPCFEGTILEGLDCGNHIVLDLSFTSYLGPDALGSLIHLAARAKRDNRELWLTGLRPFLLRAVRATQLGSLFRVAPKATDALRQIAPAELQMSIESGKDWAVCRVGNKSIPMRTEEVPTVCQQVLQLLEGGAPVRGLADSSATGSSGMD